MDIWYLETSAEASNKIVATKVEEKTEQVKTKQNNPKLQGIVLQQV